MPSVQHVRFAKFRVIVTALVGLAILATLVALLTGGTLFQPQSALYLYVPDATGLAAGSPVRVDGIRVGKIGSVTLSGSSDPNRVVKVTMIVERDRLGSITADSTAQPAADTLVGDKFIQISSGQSAQRVQPGMEIPFKGSPDLVRSLDLSQFRKSLEQMDELLTGIENGESELGQFIMQDDMYRSLLRRVAELQSGVRAAASTTSAVGRHLYGDDLYRQIAQPIAKLDDTLARLQSGQGNLGRMLRDDAQYQQIRDQIGALHKSVAEIRSGELLTSTASYEQWNRNVAGWIQKVDEFSVTPLLGTTAVYDNLNGMAKELQGTVKEFRGNPKKFLWMKMF